MGRSGARSPPARLPFGDDPATRFFKVNATGLQLSTCTCGAKGGAPGAEFGTDKNLLCFDPASDTVTSAKVSRRRIVGQTFIGSLDVRSAFTCRPDPTCDLPPILEPAKPPVHGVYGMPLPPTALRTPVTVQGQIDVGYLNGCVGFASEAATLAVDTEPVVPGRSAFWLTRAPTSPYPAGLLVRTPSGATYWYGGGRSRHDPTRGRRARSHGTLRGRERWWPDERETRSRTQPERRHRGRDRPGR